MIFLFGRGVPNETKGMINLKSYQIHLSCYSVVKKKTCQNLKIKKRQQKNNNKKKKINK